MGLSNIERQKRHRDKRKVELDQLRTENDQLRTELEAIRMSNVEPIVATEEAGAVPEAAAIEETDGGPITEQVADTPLQVPETADDDWQIASGAVPEIIAPEITASELADDGWQMDHAGIYYTAPDPGGGFYLVSSELQGDLYRVFFAVDGVVQVVGAEATLEAAKMLAEGHKDGTGLENS